MPKNWNVQFKQRDCERVNLDHREVDNSESCSEGRRVECEKSDLFKKFKTTRNKLVAGRDAKVTTGQILDLALA